MANSTTRPKPSKPHEDFPLTPANNGQWCKRVRGKLHYFGVWEDPQAALERWLEVKDDLLAGRVPRPKGDCGPTLKNLIDRWLGDLEDRSDAGEISRRHFDDCYSTATRIVVATLDRHLLLTQLVVDDFDELARAVRKGRGLSAQNNELRRCRMLFKYAWDKRMVVSPLPYDHSLKAISRQDLRKHKQKQEAENGKKVFTAEHIRDLIDAADLQLRAMIYLGINCGFGNHDVGRLPTHFVDLDGGWIDFPRPKTGVERRCPLWSETIDAIREYPPGRTEPRHVGHRHLLFVTKYRGSWYKENRENPISRQFSRLLREIDKDADEPRYRRGYGFYVLRHTFETIASQTGDQVAVNAIMGHADESMAENYRHEVWEQRLRSVSEHVRCWLLTTDQEAEETDEVALIKFPSAG